MLPVGAFAFSSGVESAVQKGVVRDPETLRGYALTALEQAAKGDGVAIVWATRAALAGNIKELMRIDHEAFARKLNEETRLMTTRMGKKLAEMGAEITEDPLIARWRDAVREGRTPGTYPLLHEVLTVHLYGVAMTILNASMRLMRITHIDIQRTLYGLTRHFDPLCRLSMQLSLEQMSAFAPMTDILAANHVKARVRLFMN